MGLGGTLEQCGAVYFQLRRSIAWKPTLPGRVSAIHCVWWFARYRSRITATGGGSNARQESCVTNDQWDPPYNRVFIDLRVSNEPRTTCGRPVIVRGKEKNISPERPPGERL